jgi:hypothetical protein
MDERSLIAWLAAGGAMVFVSVLLWRRSKPLSLASTRYPVLEKAMRLAMALAVGVLAGLVVLLFASTS